MAGFCTKCGATLSDTTAFCTSCGAPVAATGAGPTSGSSAYMPPASTPPAPAAYTPPTYTPPASAAPPSAPPASNAPASSFAYAQSAYTPGASAVGTAATPQKGGNTALKIILIVVVAFVGLGVLAAAGFGYFAYRVSRAVHISDKGGGAVEISTPGGSFSAGSTSVSASDLGVDIYPGAAEQKGAVRISTPSGTAITGVFETSDTLDKVVAFYKDKLGSAASVYQSDKGAVLTLADEAKKTSVMVTVSAEDADGKTKIAIMHSTSTS